MSYRNAKPGFILLLALLLGACASQVPLPIREAPADSPSLAVVRAQDADYLGQRVRWGGTIIETGNRENATWLTVLGKPLDKSGEPGFGDDGAGRFIAIVPGFLDPKVYAPDRRVTVSGTLARFESAMVGEYPYSYPVVEAEAWYLWAREVKRPDGYDDPWRYDPWYYRPWYGPWHPYGYPYRHRY